jgi:two-component system invasion response regulator UvrY
MRVLVVDDHAVVRAGLCRLLEAEHDLEVVGETGSGTDAVRLCRELEPDVVVLDYALPGMDGLETTSQIMALGTKTRVLVLTMHANPEYATRAIRVGAAGFVVKAASANELLVALRKAADGKVYVSPTVLEKMVGRMSADQQDAPEAMLSDREMQVLVRLARGATTREVSDALGLSMSTVETYRSRILQKLSLRNNSDITRFAIRRKLIELD